MAVHESVAAGMPAPGDIVEELTLIPPRPASFVVAAAAAAPASAVPASYRILRTNEVDAYDNPPAFPVAADAAAAAAGGDNFAGNSRKKAKLSLANATMEIFADAKDLIGTLPAHNAMANHHPPITTQATSGRVAEERHNVRVSAFLYAASRENDNDFHLIIGRDPSLPAVYMTVEISGLPPASSVFFGRLKAARSAFQTFFGANLPGSRYDFYDPPIPCLIEGSLFFDMNHATGSRPGPSNLRPKMPVVWEIHPISSITLEP